jgi:hypothetical protein
MEYVLICVAAFILLLIFGKKTAEREKEKKTDSYEKAGIDLHNLISIGGYIGGHPNVDNHYPSCIAYTESNMLKIYEDSGSSYTPRFLAGINMYAIKDITIEDATTIEKKVTLGRVFLVGVYALAWQKKKKNEMAFLAIDWSDGTFEHSTLFSFEGHDAMQNANIARNMLIRATTSLKQSKRATPQSSADKEYTQDEAQKKIGAWQRLLDKRLITQAEFDKKKNELKIKS